MQTKEFRPFAVLLGLTLGLVILAASCPIYAAGHSRARTKAKHGKKASQTANSTPITTAAPVKPIPQRVSPLTAEAAPAPAAMSSQTNGAAQPTYEETADYLKGRLGTGQTYSIEDGTRSLMVTTYDFSEKGLLKITTIFYNGTSENASKSIVTTSTTPLNKIKPSWVILHPKWNTKMPCPKITGNTSNNLQFVDETTWMDYNNKTREEKSAQFGMWLDENMDEVTQKRVVNALRHLVELSGGKENAPDPFAKP